MQKAILIFLSLLALSTAFSIYAEDEGTTTVTNPTTNESNAPAETTPAPTVPSGPAETTPAPTVPSGPAETTPAPTVPTTVAPVNPTTVISGTTEKETCLYQSETWSLDDPRMYYWCLDDKPIRSECNEGSYFVNNATVSGCIPEVQMNPSCVNLDVKVGPCEGINLKQPQASKILTNFWLCTKPNSPPVELTCPKDMAFVKQNGYLGCFGWQAWRSFRKCNN